MPVCVKSPSEVAGIRAAGLIVAGALETAEREVRPGVTLKRLGDACESYIRRQGGIPTFLGYRGFPAPVCVSINSEVVHGIPDSRVLVRGDIVKIDVGVTRDGLIADAARTFLVGEVAAEVGALVAATEESFWQGVAQARPGRHVTDISCAIQSYVESRGYSVVRDLCGHGVGVNLHEEPSVPNFGPPGKGMRLVPGMTLAVEPMVNMGRYEVDTLDNGWTVVARDGLPSAHYENTLVVTEDGPEILTMTNAESGTANVSGRLKMEQHG